MGGAVFQQSCGDCLQRALLVGVQSQKVDGKTAAVGAAFRRQKTEAGQMALVADAAQQTGGQKRRRVRRLLLHGPGHLIGKGHGFQPRAGALHADGLLAGRKHSAQTALPPASRSDHKLKVQNQIGRRMTQID